MICGIPDKLLVKWLGDKDYIKPSDEAEGVSICGGYYLATGKKATMFMSADGFCNVLNPLTSWIIPEKIKIKLVISTGRTESQHIVMTKILKKIIKILEKNDKAKAISYKIIEK